jgi:perosamine synthetase
MSSTQDLALVGGPRLVPEDSHRTWPEITEQDRAALMAVCERGVLCGANAPEITALERDYAAYLGVDHCLAVNSGTAALHCCAAALGLEPGDEVIVPAYTFIASALAMVHHGCLPVFCDVDPCTYNLDPSRIEERLTDRTRAIMAVHIHGQPADMDQISVIAERHGLAVIEDVAQAHGGIYRARKVGTIGECAGMSLNQSKNLPGGEGGLFVTDDPGMFRAARRLSVFGEDLVPLSARAFWSHGVGWNYRNQELSSALARSQLTRLDHYNATAERNGAILTAGLTRVPGVTPPYVAEDRSCSYWKYMIQLDPKELAFDGAASELRDRVLLALQAEGVKAMVWQPQPVPAQPVFRRPLRPWHEKLDEQRPEPWDADECPVASRIVDISLALGTEDKPLYVQEPALMECYVEAVDKVMRGMEAVLAAPFSPIERVRDSAILS